MYEPGVTVGVKAARQESLHLEKHDYGAGHWTEGAPTKGQALRKRRVSGIWHWCWVLIVLSFSIPGPQTRKAWHVSALICMWRVPELVTPPTPHTYIHIHWLQPPPAFGDLHCRNSCQGNSLSQRERESERGSTGGREGNQLLEKYCLSIPCQELVCVVAFFWASVALALWLQPPTPLSTVNSTMGGLGRKLTKTTAKQNRFLKCVCFCMCVYVRLCSGIAEICSRFSHMLICGWQSGVRKKDFMLWYHSKYP